MTASKPTDTFDPMSADAFISLSSMEGIYDPIVEVQYIKPLSADAVQSYSSMEGVLAPTTIIAPVVSAPVAAAKPSATPWHGYIAAAIATLLAYLLQVLPVAPFTIRDGDSIRHPISAAIVAILVGLAIRNLLPVPLSIVPGCKRIVKKVIPYAIVMTGAGLNLKLIATVGIGAFVVTVLCIVVAVGASYYIGRLFGLRPTTAMLIGAGTGICGNSAIVAVAPLIDSNDEDLVLSVGTINLMGLLAMLACPLVGQWLHMESQAFGVWAGTTIHAVPQVVAAGFAYSAEAATIATTVKLVRVTLLAPLVAILAVFYARRHTSDVDRGRSIVVHYARFVPWFVWGFILIAVLNTAGLIPTLSFQPSETIGGIIGLSGEHIEVSLSGTLKQCAKILLTLAMAAIGLELDIRKLVGVGSRALTVGFAAAVILSCVSLLLITLLL